MGKEKRIFRSIIICLIGICLFMPIIYSIHFYCNRMLHRMEMWEKAESRLLKTIELDSTTIHWTKKNRELIVHGEYFDIVSITYMNGKATIKGVFDDEETEMHEAFARKQQNDNESGSSTQKIANWLQLLWTFEEAPPNKNLMVFLVKNDTPFYSFFLVNTGKKPPFPPPWRC